MAIGLGAMARDGGFAAFWLFALVGFFGGTAPIVFIALVFAISIVVSVLSKKLDKARNKEAHSPRRATQILAVGLLPLLALILHALTELEVFYYVYYLAVAEQIADSMASDIGRLTKKQNVSIITLRPIEKGISGGVSALGTVAALVSSFLVSLIPLLFGEINAGVYLLISLVAFFGTLIDSLLGALLQSLYTCEICGAKTESRTHCDAPAKLVKGVRFIDNVAVNYISGILTAAIGALLLLI